MNILTKNHVALEKIDKKAWTTSTLEIPLTLLVYFTSRAKQHKGLRHYFRHLIVTYGRHLNHFGVSPVTKQWKKKYQNQKLNLQPRHFVPDPQVWEEFRHISFAYGPSMCHMFVILLKLEYSRWVKAGYSENFCEKPPKTRFTTPKKRNYVFNKNQFRKKGKNIQKLGSRTTHLYRIIDFSRMELTRIAVIV